MSDPINLVGYHLTFDAEMTTASDMSQFATAFYNGDTTLWTNQEAENYKPYSPSDPNSPFSFANGALTITASPVPSGNLPYTSGMLQTAATFQQNQGYFEIRAQATGAQGFWPAFWLLPTSYYPEIDILEQPNNSGSASKYWTSIHTPDDNTAGFSDVGVDLSAGYHSYGFMWTATSIQFTFDGQYIGDARATPAALAGLKMYLIANLAVGGPGSWPGQPIPGTSATYKIDYIRAFSNDPAAPAVLPEAISSPDGVNTAPVLAIVPITIGAGPDALTLQVSEDPLHGDAQFTISVDGVQQGGTQTALALHSAGKSQAFTVLGTFGTSIHDVTVNFLNDANGQGGDRNLFVTGATINGKAIANAVLNEYSGGPQDFSFKGTVLQPVPVQVTIGSGADTFLFGISENAYLGHALFTISVDGVQQGGVLTAGADHAAGQSQVFAVQGSFGPGAHAATVVFLNDAYGGSADADRNLYVDSLRYDGTDVRNGTATLLAPGAANFKIPSQTASGAPARVTIGSGADTFLFGISEDAYQGDALFTISIDGVQQGGTQTASADHASAQSQVFAVQGSFGTGAHVATVNFLNDAYGGSASADRNLYVDSLSYDGATVRPGTAALLAPGPVGFTVPSQVTAGTPVPALVTIGTGADAFLFKVSEDAYAGDALFTISIDGVQQGGIQTARADHASGQSQVFAVQGSFGKGAHVATVSFLNDAYGGSAAADRNMYVDGLSYDGANVRSGTAALLNPGPVSFAVPASDPAAKLNTVSIAMTEDAYNGDAMAQITLDGVILGNETITFLNSANKPQVFTYTGSFGSGAHTLRVNFLNDAYGGSSSADRNLYVKGITYDAAQVPGAGAALLAGGPVDFTIPAGTGLIVSPGT